MNTAAATSPRFAYHSLSHAIALVTFTACLMVVSGCSESRGDRLAVFPVSGQVTLNGKPLANALVVLHPKVTPPSKGVAARGTTDANGSFQMSTYDANDGAPSGEYAVTVQHYPLVKKGESFEPGPNSLPPKLGKPDTTNLPVVHVADAPVSVPTIAIRR